MLLNISFPLLFIFVILFTYNDWDLEEYIYILSITALLFIIIFDKDVFNILQSDIILSLIYIFENLLFFLPISLLLLTDGKISFNILIVPRESLEYDLNVFVIKLLILIFDEKI